MRTLADSGSVTDRPSRLSLNLDARDSVVTSTTHVSLTTSGRIVSEWGAIGAIDSAGASGAIIGPDTDRL